MAGDARAFLADGLLGNLHQDLLAFLEQVADFWNFLRLATREAPSTSPASTALPVETRTRARRPLRIASCPGLSSNLRPGIDSAGSASFGGQQSLGLGLGLF